MKVDSGEIT